MTTAPAPTIELSPIVTSAKIVALDAIQTLLAITIFIPLFSYVACFFNYE
ncbi:MAG: hypothetical protein HEQ35_31225 [Gloeotrichia echinulata IR180]